ncbi:MAG: hypothetical protein LQ352_001060, partial [Teloschistes flavicans]
MAVAGLLMFGKTVRDEITSNIFLTKGFPRAISIIMVIFIAIIPITKIPLNSRPIISSMDKVLSLDARSIASPPFLTGMSETSRGLLRSLVRIVVTVVILIIGIFVPSFDTVMSLMGSVFCFGICIILPLAFYLKLFGHEISTKEKILDWVMIVVSVVLAVVGTVWAALACFKETEYDLEPQSSIKDVFSSIQSSTAAYGVVPFENSTYGTVVFTLDLLVDRESNYPDLLVCGEIYLPVHHCLVVARPASTIPSGGVVAEKEQPPQQQQQQEQQPIKTLYSHPAAFGQCERFLSTRFPEAEKIDVSSTSKAAELVATAATSYPSARNAAAVSSKLAAELHGLHVQAEGIQDSDDNSTRFFVIRNRLSSPPPPSLTANNPRKQEDEEDADHDCKSLISFSLPLSPAGALAD